MAQEALLAQADRCFVEEEFEEAVKHYTEVSWGRSLMIRLRSDSAGCRGSARPTGR